MWHDVRMISLDSAAPLPVRAVLRVDRHGKVVAKSQSARELLGHGLGMACSAAVAASEIDGARLCTSHCVAQLLASGEGAGRRSLAKIRGHRARLECQGLGEDVIILIEPVSRGLGSMASLTKREIQVLTLIRQGMTSRRIAAELKVAHSTIRRHVENARMKLGARNRAEAVALAIEQGQLPPRRLLALESA
jgi:DNA-binding CsgD family transcriptional regulator